jgi:hypothetical protein
MEQGKTDRSQEAKERQQPVWTPRKFSQKILELQDDPAFQGIESRLKTANPFRILGTTDRERWHSAFWGWILDPKGSHGLGDFAAKRLLNLGTDENGALRAVRLGRSRGTEQLAWSARRTTSVGRLVVPIRDILRFEVQHSVAAPSPTSLGSEVGPLLGRERARGKLGDQGRFDVLLFLQGEDPDEEIRSPLSILVVIEFKVFASYDPDQLEKYSSWLFGNPAPEGIGRSEASSSVVDGLQSRMAAIEHQSGSLFSLGIFVSQHREKGLRSPERLEPAWVPLQYNELILQILEPMLLHPRLDPESRYLVRSYIDMAASPDSKMLEGTSAEMRELVLDLLERHRDTFRVIAAALKSDGDEEGQELAETLDPEKTGRAKRLSPQALLDAGLAEIGNHIQHDPVIPRGGDKAPFDGPVTAAIINGSWRAYRLVEGGEVDLPGEYSATNLLDRVYEHHGATFTGNGNNYWRFVDGPSKGKLLFESYDEIRSAGEVESSG